MIFAMAAPGTANVIRCRSDGHALWRGIRSRPQICTAEIRVTTNWEGEMVSSGNRSIRPITGVADITGQSVVASGMAALVTDPIRCCIPGRRYIMAGGTGTDGIPDRIGYMAEGTIVANCSDRPGQTRMTQAAGCVESCSDVVASIVVGHIEIVRSRIIPASIISGRGSRGRGMSRSGVVTLYASRGRGVSSWPGRAQLVLNDIHRKLRVRTTAGRGGMTTLTVGQVDLGVWPMCRTRPIGPVCRMRCSGGSAPDAGSAMATDYIRAGRIGWVSGIVVIKSRQ